MPDLEFQESLGELPADLDLEATARPSRSAPGMARRRQPARKRPPARQAPVRVNTINRVNISPFPAETVAGSKLYLPKNIQRRYLSIQNHSESADLWLNFGAAAAEFVGYKITAGGYFWWDANGVPVGSVSVYCAAAGERFTLGEG